jgi:hypothetical protein
MGGEGKRNVPRGVRPRRQVSKEKITKGARLLPEKLEAKRLRATRERERDAT